MLLSHYNIANDDKKVLIGKVFKDSLSQLTLNFLNLLVDKKRINALAKICEEFNSLANKNQGIQEGTVYSSVKLSDDSLQKIKQRIEKENHTTVELINIVDEKLIGGFKVVIKDTVYDNSLKNKIDSLRYELLEGKRWSVWVSNQVKSVL